MATTTAVKRTSTFTVNIIFGTYEVSFFEDGVIVEKKSAPNLTAVQKIQKKWNSK